MEKQNVEMENEKLHLEQKFNNFNFSTPFSVIFSEVLTNNPTFHVQLSHHFERNHFDFKNIPLDFFNTKGNVMYVSKETIAPHLKSNNEMC